MKRSGRGYTKKKILHVISHVAIPHNNVLMKALEDSGECELHLYYSARTTGLYAWGDEIFQAVGQPVELGAKGVYWPLIRDALCRRDQHFLFIGWPNNTARLLLLLFWVFRRTFLFWSDFPNEDERHYPYHVAAVRSFLYHIVKTKACRIFLVGEHAVSHFKHLGYPGKKLTNLPIFIAIDKTKKDFFSSASTLRDKYGLKSGELLFASGSRLIPVKGYQDLIESIRVVRERSRTSFRVVIVGKGEQSSELRERISALGLSDIIKMEPWMAPKDFEALIACSDAYIHPARFDAFGGGTLLAMALGVPVIGSDGAGVVTERVKDGINGLVFPAGDVRRQADRICWFLKHLARHEKMGKAARKTAEAWPPERGAQIILHNLPGQKG